MFRLPHIPIILRAPDLGSREHTMQNRRRDFELEVPEPPRRTKLPHNNGCFDSRGQERSNTGRAILVSGPPVVVGVDAFHDDDAVHPAFAKGVEQTW
jgi:hypothetical protein